MINFYALYETLYEGVQLRLEQLQTACNKLGVNFVALNSSEIDYTDLPRLTKSDLLYNVAAGSTTLESLLLNDYVTTFYIKNPSYINHSEGTIPFTYIHEKKKLKSPKTIFHLTTNRQLLNQYVKYLQGFPLIIKVAGSSRGIGTIKIDSWQSLISTVDYLITTGDKFIMREFIHAVSGCRLIVLGHEVIAGADFEMNENDFRNAIDLSQIKYHKKTYPKDVVATAIKASHLANVEFSGVDFLQDANGEFFLLEANFPTGFSGLIDICDVDIPFKMVEHLLHKTRC